MFADRARLGVREQMWCTNVAEKLQEEGTARCKAATELEMVGVLCDAWLGWAAQGCFELK